MKNTSMKVFGLLTWQSGCQKQSLRSLGNELRQDHLHNVKDKEFQYAGEQNDFFPEK